MTTVIKPTAWQAKFKDPGEIYSQEWFQISPEEANSNPDTCYYRPLFTWEQIEIMLAAARGEAK